MMIDDELSFSEYLEYAFQKEMPNFGSPKDCSRLLLAGVVRSILLCATPKWAEALANAQRRKQVNLVNRVMAFEGLQRF